MTIEVFVEEVKKLGLEPTPQMLNQLQIYANFLKEYNEHTNLTRITKDEDIYLKHFYDSLTILKEIDLTQVNNLIDIGTGAGFPGMVLKIFFPNLKVTLLDSNNKKITFLQELQTKLGVDNLTLVHSRIETFALDNRETFDVVTSRAVANLITLTELALPLVKINGHFIALKGNLEEEEDATYAINILGGAIEHTSKFVLPIEQSTRNIINIVKVKPTPQNYPRPYDKIIKKPLKKKVK